MYGLSLAPSPSSHANKHQYVTAVGPDQILPADDFCTANPCSSVRLRIPIWGGVEQRPRSVPTLLKEVALKHPGYEALAYKVECTKKKLKPTSFEWKFITYAEYHGLVRCCAKAFLKLGLERHRAVCILGYNCPEWFVADLAAIFAGGIAVGIYPASSSAACKYCIRRSKACIVLVEDQEQLAKIISTRFDHVKAVVQYKDTPRCQGVLSWNELLKIGNLEPEFRLEEVLSRMAVNECCTAIYNNDDDRPVMLSHDNITWTAFACTTRFSTRCGWERIISYLPLNRIAVQIFDIYFSIMNAGCTYFVLDKNCNLEDDDQFRTLFVDQIREVKPTTFLGMPVIWTKLMQVVEHITEQRSSMVRRITWWARQKAYQFRVAKIEGTERNSWRYFVSRYVVLNKIKMCLGLKRSSLNLSIGGSLSTEIRRYFLTLDMPVSDIYGFGECTGYQTICHEEAYGMGTVGQSFPGTQTTIFSPGDDGFGTITMHGRNIFMGYMNDLEETHRVVDENGWFHSKDVGTIDQQHFLYLTRSLKSTLTMADGETIPIHPVEEAVKEELPRMHHVVLVGERKTYLSVLLTLYTELGLNGWPSELLTIDVQTWLEELGCHAATLSELIGKKPPKKLCQAINKALDRVNRKVLSGTDHLIEKFVVLSVDLSEKLGDVTARGKVRRMAVLEKYAELINTLYRGRGR